jgi:hypothetical protein
VSLCVIFVAPVPRSILPAAALSSQLAERCFELQASIRRHFEQLGASLGSNSSNN